MFGKIKQQLSMNYKTTFIQQKNIPEVQTSTTAQITNQLNNLQFSISTWPTCPFLPGALMHKFLGNFGKTNSQNCNH